MSSINSTNITSVNATIDNLIVGTIISTISLNFDLLFDNQINGNKLLFDNIKYRPKPII